jgi:hypothetical protein
LIENALYQYVDIAADTVFDDPVNDPVKHLRILLNDNPGSTYDAITVGWVCDYRHAEDDLVEIFKNIRIFKHYKIRKKLLTIISVNV